MNRIPIIIPSSSSCSSIGGLANDGLLLCQFEDASVITQGESGAIGRVSIGSNGIKFDIKGKQYSGSIFPTFTTLIISNPSSKAKTSQASSGEGNDADTNRAVSLSQSDDIASQNNSNSNSNSKSNNIEDLDNSNGKSSNNNNNSSQPKLEAKLKSISNQICYFKLENSTFDNFEEGFANTNVDDGDEDDGKGEDVSGKKRKLAEQQAKNKKNKNLINISSNVQKKKKPGKTSAGKKSDKKK